MPFLHHLVWCSQKLAWDHKLFPNLSPEASQLLLDYHLLFLEVQVEQPQQSLERAPVQELSRHLSFEVN